MSATDPDQAHELTLTRRFNCTRERLFDLWTNPRQLARWWGPKDFVNPVCEVDVRPGGAIRIEMVGPDGVTYPLTGVYREVVAPERLVYTIRMALDEAVTESVSTVTFTPEGGGVRLTVHNRFTSLGGRTLAEWGIVEGWGETLDRLDALA